jgi:ketosteroid isomerase-like protein
MSEANLVGGTDADRKEILRLHEKYIDVNARFDWENLQPIFSPAPEATYFNLNGHTYRGREHWTKLWKFYVQNVQSGYWTPYDIGGTVTGDLAVVWCHRETQRKWTGTEPPPRDINYANQKFFSRSTMVFRKEDGQWRVVHAHFSPGDSGPRPGGV